jgi:predicted RNase H-like HicB family nuclease
MLFVSCSTLALRCSAFPNVSEKSCGKSNPTNCSFFNFKNNAFLWMSISSLRFVVADEEEGGFTAAAPVPKTQTTLRTEANSLEELYKNIAEVVEAYCAATHIETIPSIKIKLPSSFSPR